MSLRVSGGHNSGKKACGQTKRVAAVHNPPCLHPEAEVSKRTPPLKYASTSSSTWCCIAEAARPCALRMDWAACVLPRHGEDAHFGHAEAGFVGVADKASRLRRRLRTEDVLERAYETAFMNGTPGVSTTVVLSLDRTTLRWAYIGDSAFAVLPDGKMVHRLVQQQHCFNFPYQLSSSGDGDYLTRAMVGDMPVEDGNIVVVGTDGLFDNMYDGQLERAVQMGTELGLSPKNMADIVAGIAYRIYGDKWAHLPYSRQYSKAYRN